MSEQSAVDTRAQFGILQWRYYVPVLMEDETDRILRNWGVVNVIDAMRSEEETLP